MKVSTVSTLCLTVAMVLGVFVAYGIAMPQQSADSVESGGGCSSFNCGSTRFYSCSEMIYSECTGSVGLACSVVPDSDLECKDYPNPCVGSVRCENNKWSAGCY